jgi:hypothetical protein
MPTTKRSPAQSLAKKQPSYETRSEAVPGTVLSPRGSASLHELSQTHELIIDAVADLLTQGGHSDDIDSLLYAAMAHTRRRTYSRCCDDAVEVDGHASDFVRKNLSDWKTDLAIGWRRNRRGLRPDVDQKTISERIRFNTRERIWDSFEDFMSRAGFEDQALMLNVLSNHENRNRPAESKANEIYLATAFATEIDQSVAYLRVPVSMLAMAEKYISALRAIEDKAVA